MPAGKLNLRIEQGATYRKRLVWKDKSKRPVVMTGFTALMHVKDKLGGELLLALSTENGRITLGAGGAITILLTAGETAAINFETAVYDMKIFAGAENIRLLEGRIVVSRAVTAVVP